MKFQCAAILLASVILVSVSGCGGDSNEPTKPNYPQTRSGTDQDVFFGKTVRDPYRWLEDVTSVETDTWIREQNNVTHAYIAAMDDFGSLSKRVESLLAPAPVSKAAQSRRIQDSLQRVEGVQDRQGRFYYQIKTLREHGESTQPQQKTGFGSVDNVIYVADREGGVAKGTPLVDVNGLRIDPDDHIQLLKHRISEDGRYLAYGLIRNHSDLAELHVIDLQNAGEGPFLKIPHVLSASFTMLKGGIAYSSPLTVVNEHVSAYTDQVLYFQPYSGGKPQAWAQGDKYENVAPMWADANHFYYLVSTGTGSAISRLNLADPQSRKELIVDGRQSHRTFEPIGESAASPRKILVKTSQGAPLNRLIEMDLDHPAPENWHEILPRSPAGETEYVNNIISCGEHYYAEHLVSGSSRLFHYGQAGRSEILLPGTGSVGELGCNGDGGGARFYYSSLVQPYTSITYDPLTHQTTSQDAFVAPGYEPSQYEMSHHMATSKDGTAVSIYLAHKKGLVPNSQAPTMLYVYGGFGVPVLPAFDKKYIPLLESGGVYAIAQVRGGAEVGNGWAEAGRLLNKQNTYDDIAAAAEQLIKEGYTQPGKLALEGGSNGGLSTAVLGQQRPDLFAVVFPTVGVLDLLRYDLFTYGFNWHGEYGQPTDQTQFENLMRISPLHNVQAKSYRPTYVFTGKTDARVLPAHSYKYVAALQNQAGGSEPYLLYAFSKDGHQLESNRAQHMTYMWSAFFHHTGTRYHPGS